MLLNCDIGERGPHHSVDRELMNLLDVANLACSGHAGDAESIAAFRALAGGKQLSAHLSYPDRENFGRTAMKLPLPELLSSLQAQSALLPDCHWLKFHGALYNVSTGDANLARVLADWSASSEYEFVITLPGGALAEAAIEFGLEVVAEAFAERRYEVRDGRLLLMSRANPRASITDLAEAIEQSQRLIEDGRVLASVNGQDELVDCPAETICVHSDSAIALPLARQISAMLDKAGR